MEHLHQLRRTQGVLVKECQLELRYLKQNKDKAQEIRDMLADKEAQLVSSKDSVRKIGSQIEPLEVGHPPRRPIG